MTQAEFESATFGFGGRTSPSDFNYFGDLDGCNRQRAALVAPFENNVRTGAIGRRPLEMRHAYLHAMGIRVAPDTLGYPGVGRVKFLCRGIAAVPSHAPSNK